MPELPEVETIKLQLQKYLVGHKIEKIDVRVAKIFREGKEKLIGGKVKNLRRFGKVLVVDLDNGYSFLVHLKLTGQLVYSGSKIPNQPNKFTHIIFYLDDGARLFFNDVRKFGWIKVAESTKLTAQNGFVGKLGPEPFNLTPTSFSQIVGSSRKPIKLLLMDQESLSGVGNIYANDALWLAGLNPKRSAKSLGPSELSKLYRALIDVLRQGLKFQGASDQWYVTAEGKKGEYQEHFLVYGREGEICRRCKKEKIIKIKLGGRGTYFCPRCQK